MDKSIEEGRPLVVMEVEGRLEGMVTGEVCVCECVVCM